MSECKRCGSCKHASNIGGGVSGCDSYLGDDVCAMPVHVEPPYDDPCEHYESVSYEPKEQA